MAGTELEILRNWTGWFCHKLPERSPQCGAEIFPVCFRCAGVQLGLAASYLAIFVRRGWSGRFPSVRVTMQCAALMLPLTIDGAGNALGWWNSPGWLRGLTGLGVGLSLPWLLAPLAQPLELATDPAAKPSLEKSAQLLWPAVGGIIAIVSLARGCGLFWFQIWATAAAAGWCFFLGHFVLALVRAYGGGFLRRLISTGPAPAPR